MKQSIFEIIKVGKRTPWLTPKTPRAALPISLPEYLVNHQSQDMSKCYGSTNLNGKGWRKWWLVLYESCGWMGQDIVERSLPNIHANSDGAESQQQLQHLFKIDQDDSRTGKWRTNASKSCSWKGHFQRVCKRCHSWCDGHKSVRERIRRVVKKCGAYWVWFLETPCLTGAVRFGYARYWIQLARCSSVHGELGKWWKQ